MTTDQIEATIETMKLMAQNKRESASKMTNIAVRVRMMANAEGIESAINVLQGELNDAEALV